MSLRSASRSPSCETVGPILSVSAIALGGSTNADDSIYNAFITICFVVPAIIRFGFIAVCNAYFPIFVIVFVGNCAKKTIFGFVGIVGVLITDCFGVVTRDRMLARRQDVDGDFVAIFVDDNSTLFDLFGRFLKNTKWKNWLRYATITS